MDLISGNCPRLFQTSAGEKVGDHAKEWTMRACQGQDACLKHWMNWNCSEKCGFVIKLCNFTSCVLLIGDNSHLMFKPQPDSLKKKNPHLLVTTSYKTDHIPQEPVVWGWPLWAGCPRKSLEWTGPGERIPGHFTNGDAVAQRGIGIVQSHPAMKSQGSFHPE